MGLQARQAHQEDVPYARPERFNAFLCRCPGGTRDHAATRTADLLRAAVKSSCGECLVLMFFAAGLRAMRGATGHDGE
jgi:hypothetical protein